MKYLCITLALLCAVDDAYAEQKFSTEFLAPKEIWAVNFNFSRGSVSSIYDNDGDQQSLSSGLSATLNSTVLPQLALLEAAFPGSSLGDVEGRLSFETKFLEITAGYGLTDDLSLGFRLPIGESCSKAGLTLSNATLGVNPAFDPTASVSPANSPFLPSALPGVNAFSSADLDALLKSSEFSYTDTNSHCESGLMGPIFGASWRVYKGEYDSLILLPGVRLGRLTDKADADVLFQPIIDDGSNDIILRADYYRDLQHALDLTVQLEYNIQLRDRKTVRVPDSPLALSAASSKQRLKRDLGDFVILDIELGYRFWNDQLRVFTAYYHKYKDRDSYTSSLGTDTQFLERNTTFRDQEIRTGIYYDGVPAWRAGKLPFPLRLELNYWESFDGKNSLKYYFTELSATFAF